jgi:hypothetical protein
MKTEKPKAAGLGKIFQARHTTQGAELAALTRRCREQAAKIAELERELIELRIRRDQSDARRAYARGGITYAELRRICG